MISILIAHSAFLFQLFEIWDGLWLGEQEVALKVVRNLDNYGVERRLGDGVSII